jgi:putative NADH-flavin reductase
MRIAVVAASGRVGGYVVRHALETGHEVLSVVRSASRAPAGTPAFETSATEVRGLARAFDEVDAVISCVGHVKGQPNPHLLAESARSVVKAAGDTRLVFISASGAFTGGDDPITRFIAKPILNRVLRENMADTRAMEAQLRSTSANWTTIRPSQLVDRVGKHPYRSRVDLSIPWGFQTTYVAVAQSCVDALATPAWIGHAVSVAD